MDASAAPEASHARPADEFIPPPHLQAFAVKRAPHGTFYIPDFVDAVTEEMLLQKVQNAPKTKWTQLRNRRLQSWGGTVQNYDRNAVMIQEQLPAWILDQCSAVQRTAGLPCLPNHCLINEYLPGQGIMSHVDGPVYFPCVANLSLGSHTVMNLTPYRHPDDHSQHEPAVRLLLQPRSLLLLSSDAYTSWSHGIDEVAEDTIDATVANLQVAADRTAPEPFSLARATRVSLTIRHVTKVRKNPFKL